jgi:capsular polysaccharide biosynthesis protein
MNETQKRDSVDMDIRRLFLVIWQKLWIIVLTGVVLGGLAFGYAWMFITPTYEASTQIYVNNQLNENDGFSSSQLSAAHDLAYTYMVILESRNVLNDVAEKTGLGYSYEQLKSMIRSSTVNGTEVFQVVVKNTNYKHATTIANAVAEVLPDKIAAVVDGSSVRIVDYAVENPKAVGPDYKKYVLLGALTGVLLSAAFVVVKDLLDTTIKSEEYLTSIYSHIPLLAVVPGAESSKSGYYKGYKNNKGYYDYAKKPRPGTENGGAEK